MEWIHFQIKRRSKDVLTYAGTMHIVIIKNNSQYLLRGQHLKGGHCCSQCCHQCSHDCCPGWLSFLQGASHKEDHRELLIQRTLLGNKVKHQRPQKTLGNARQLQTLCSSAVIYSTSRCCPLLSYLQTLQCWRSLCPS